jgi:Cu(I)/Ag(I) efflux system membrane fusion protein
VSVCLICGHTVVGDLPDKCPVCAAAKEYYTCPMHESVRSDSPGACPDCGMTLMRKSVQNEVDALDLATLKAVSLSPSQRVMANVTTAKVEWQTFSRDVQAVGVVSFAEPNYQVISMRFPGRIEKLYLTFAGQTVRKGDPVAKVYSPDVITEEQIDDLGKSDTLSSYVTILSPVTGTVVKKRVDPGSYFDVAGAPLFDVADLSTVWILLDVYEKDIRYIRTGQSVLIATEAYPLDEFRGKIVFVDPVLTPETRTIRVRTEAANPQGKLKPNMYVNATIAVPQSRELVVPTTALVPVGRRPVVWVETKENVFEPREILVGAANERFTVVLGGLKEGEIVARTGGFLIDSESALSWTPGDDQQ